MRFPETNNIVDEDFYHQRTPLFIVMLVGIIAPGGVGVRTLLDCDNEDCS